MTKAGDPASFHSFRVSREGREHVSKSYAVLLALRAPGNELSGPPQVRGSSFSWFQGVLRGHEELLGKDFRSPPKTQSYSPGHRQVMERELKKQLVCRCADLRQHDVHATRDEQGNLRDITLWY